MVWDFLSQSFIERIHNVDLEQDSKVGDVTFQFDLPNDTCSYVLIATISFFDDNTEYNTLPYVLVQVLGDLEVKFAVYLKPLFKVERDVSRSGHFSVELFAFSLHNEELDQFGNVVLLAGEMNRHLDHNLVHLVHLLFRSLF